MSYDLNKFRVIKHGKDSETAYCRMCNQTKHEGDVQGWASDHSRRTLHTVDFYRETWTEYTCHTKDKLSTKSPTDNKGGSEEYMKSIGQKRIKVYLIINRQTGERYDICLKRPKWTQNRFWTIIPIEIKYPISNPH